MAKKDEIKYYRLNKILVYDAEYYIIIGERSNGKTYAVLEYCLEQYCISGYQQEFAVIRRWREDFKGKNGAQLFSSHIENGLIKKLTNDEYNTIVYQSSRWYFAKRDEHGEIVKKKDTPCCYAFALTDKEHDKSIAFPKIKHVLFDEFLTNQYYLPDEFVTFMNVLSTIIRLKDDVKIFMCGNTVNPYSPYFVEMGLHHIKNMKKGEIEIYNYGESGLRVAVEFSDFDCKKKKSNKYFAFNNPKLTMITGEGGTWEINIYPHLPCKYRPKDILFKYFITFDREIFQCEVISVNDLYFTYIHRKTGEFKDNGDLMFDLQTNVKSNYIQNIFKSTSPLVKEILYFFTIQKVFYQDNEVGESIRNYLVNCRKS